MQSVRSKKINNEISMGAQDNEIVEEFIDFRFKGFLFSLLPRKKNEPNCLSHQFMKNLDFLKLKSKAHWLDDSSQSQLKFSSTLISLSSSCSFYFFLVILWWFLLFLLFWEFSYYHLTGSLDAVINFFFEWCHSFSFIIAHPN